MKSIQRKYTTKRLSRNKALNTDFATLKTKDESRMIKGNVNENRVVHAKHLTHTHTQNTYNLICNVVKMEKNWGIYQSIAARIDRQK